MNLSPIDIRYANIPVTATNADGTAATITGVDVATVAHNAAIDGSTAWTAATYSAGVATVLLAAPDATPPTGALVIPATGADLWIRVTDSPEIEAVRVGYVSVS